MGGGRFIVHYWGIGGVAHSLVLVVVDRIERQSLVGALARTPDTLELFVTALGPVAIDLMRAGGVKKRKPYYLGWACSRRYAEASTRGQYGAKRGR